jgi:hypothetical protein
MFRRALRVTLWVVGSFVSLVAALYAIAVAVNWRDQPPSPDAVRLKASYESRPSIADQDNGFVYLLGIDAPLDVDPREFGARRLAWLREAIGKPFDYPGDPLITRLDYASRDPLVEQFLTQCESDSRECADAFAESGAVLDSLSATHTWLLERYRTLIGHSGWREEIFGLSRPFPSYAAPIYAQRLLLLEAKSLMDSGEVEAARRLLESDVKFWRMVLESSDMLITKMIAAAALRQHFSWGTLALRSAAPQLAATAEPVGWTRPMTAAELSLRRTLTGEWVFFSGSVLELLDSDPAIGEDTAGTRLADRLFLPLLQRQDTLNRHASYLGKLADTLEAPLTGYARVAHAASDLTLRAADDALPPRSLYNLYGVMALAAGPPEYSSYARRVADVEGMRRAALATLRARQTPIAQVAATLAADALRNPYDGQPLQWDAGDRAVVFVGLEPGERGTHRFYY